MTTADEFEARRPRLFGLAYRMLGSADEAEDTVQDACLRFDAAERTGIEYPGAWLAKVVTNLCLSRLTSARVRREQYVGTWLPEPVITAGGALGPSHCLKGVGGTPIVGRAAGRRVHGDAGAAGAAHAHRARGVRTAGGVRLRPARDRRRAVRRVGEPGSRFDAAPEHQEELVRSFVTAAREGDLAGLEKLLATDVTWWSDGGGRVSAARRPIEGREKVVRFLVGVVDRWATGLDFAIPEVNGERALAGWEGDRLVGVLVFELRDGLIAQVRTVVNPDKLGFIGRQLAGAQWIRRVFAARCHIRRGLFRPS